MGVDVGASIVYGFSLHTEFLQKYIPEKKIWEFIDYEEGIEYVWEGFSETSERVFIYIPESEYGTEWVGRYLNLEFLNRDDKEFTMEWNVRLNKLIDKHNWKRSDLDTQFGWYIIPTYSC